LHEQSGAQEMGSSAGYDRMVLSANAFEPDANPEDLRPVATHERMNMPMKNLKTAVRRPSVPMNKPGVKVRVIIHEAEEGGFWAEVPALPGCFTQGETRAELYANLRDAIEGCLLAGSGLAPSQDGIEEEIEL
jgi:predicted RNase H-like HicB family nuclease